MFSKWRPAILLLIIGALLHDLSSTPPPGNAVVPPRLPYDHATCTSDYPITGALAEAPPWPQRATLFRHHDPSLSGGLRLSLHPRVIVHPNFASASEVAHIREMIRLHERNHTSAHRISTLTVSTPILLGVCSRLSLLYKDHDFGQCETPLFRVYGMGHGVGPHYHSHLTISALLYLNTVDGGDTWFPGGNGNRKGNWKLPGLKKTDDGRHALPGEICTYGLRVHAVAGTLLSFYERFPDGEVDVESAHASCPVNSGEKAILTFMGT